MNDALTINKAIAKDNRSAYRAAKAAGRAYIMKGNTIVKVAADGTQIAITSVSEGLIKAKTKTFIVK